MVDVTTYDPKKVSIVVNNRMITGFASDSMITVARSDGYCHDGRRRPGRCDLQRKRQRERHYDDNAFRYLV